VRDVLGVGISFRPFVGVSSLDLGHSFKSGLFFMDIGFMGMVAAIKPCDKNRYERFHSSLDPMGI